MIGWEDIFTEIVPVGGVIAGVAYLRLGESTNNSLMLPDDVLPMLL